VPIAGQAPHAPFALQEGQRILSDLYPPVSLRRVVPPPRLPNTLLDLSHQVFDSIGRFEIASQLLEESQTVQRQRLLETFL
jgi:hypothetical protein